MPKKDWASTRQQNTITDFLPLDPKWINKIVDYDVTFWLNVKPITGRSCAAPENELCRCHYAIHQHAILCDK